MRQHRAFSRLIPTAIISFGSISDMHYLSLNVCFLDHAVDGKIGKSCRVGLTPTVNGSFHACLPYRRLSGDSMGIAAETRQARLMASPLLNEGTVIACPRHPMYDTEPKSLTLWKTALASGVGAMQRVRYASTMGSQSNFQLESSGSDAHRGYRTGGSTFRPIPTP